MGLLDEAIREHLELKRLRGADPSEVLRQEREALGGGRQADGEERSGSVRVVAAGQRPIDEQEQTRIEPPAATGHEAAAFEALDHQEATGQAPDEPALSAPASAQPQPGDQASRQPSPPDAPVAASAQPPIVAAGDDASETGASVEEHIGSTADFETAEVDMSALLSEREEGSPERDEALDVAEEAERQAEHYGDHELAEESDVDLIDERLAAREERLRSFERGIRGRPEKRRRRPWRS